MTKLNISRLKWNFFIELDRELLRAIDAMQHVH